MVKMKSVYLVVIEKVYNGDIDEIRDDIYIPVAVLLSKEESVDYANKYIRKTVAKYERRADTTIKHLDPYDPEISDKYDYFVTWAADTGKLDYEDLDIGSWFVDYSYRKKGVTHDPDKIGEWIRVIETKMIENET